MQQGTYQKVFGDMIEMFTIGIAQPLANDHSQRLAAYRDRYVIPGSLVAPKPLLSKPTSDLDTDEERDSEVDKLISSLCLQTIRPSTAASSSAPIADSPGTAPAHVCLPERSPDAASQTVPCRDDIAFGSLVEEGLAKLDLEESVILKIKLISVVAKENTWVGKFEKLGLSRNVASLLSILLKADRH